MSLGLWKRPCLPLLQSKRMLSGQTDFDMLVLLTPLSPAGNLGQLSLLDCVCGRSRMYERFLLSSVDGKGEDERKAKLGLCLLSSLVTFFECHKQESSEITSLKLLHCANKCRFLQFVDFMASSPTSVSLQTLCFPFFSSKVAQVFRLSSRALCLQNERV